MAFYWRNLLKPAALATALCGFLVGPLTADAGSCVSSLGGSIWDMHLADLAKFSQKQSGLNFERLEEIVNNGSRARIWGGANNAGVYFSRMDKIYVTKRLVARFDFEVERIRQQAAAAVILNDIGLGPRTAILTYSSRELWIVMEKAIGVSISRKSWNTKDPVTQATLKEGVERELGQRFESFEMARKAMRTKLMSAKEFKPVMDKAVKALREARLVGGDYEIRLALKPKPQIQIIDTTSVEVNDRPLKAHHGLAGDIERLRDSSLAEKEK